jgi:hypothetical protein
MPTLPDIYQLKVTLNDSKPPIWRRIVVPENITLSLLHEILQIVMGWENYHLHMFKIAGQIYGDPEDDEMGMMGTKNETRYRLSQLNLHEKAKFYYEYDFGDGWEHTILVEKILPAEKGSRDPLCITGKGACPPEDVGGIWGYADILQAIANPEHPEHDESLEWLGKDFDPEEFDLDAVNETLQTIKPMRGRRNTRVEPEPEGDDNFAIPLPKQQKAMSDAQAAWVQNLSREQLDALAALPVLRNLLTFLDYLSKNRTVGTQATGNLPLKAVREITGKFVTPLVLEETIQGHTYKVRSEDEVWPLFFVHTLAYQSGLVTGGQVNWTFDKVKHCKKDRTA